MDSFADWSQRQNVALQPSLETGERLYANSWRPTPVAGKSPRFTGWQAPDDFLAFFRAHYGAAGHDNIGVVAGQRFGDRVLVFLDFDFDEDAAGRAARALFGPEFLVRRSGRPHRFTVPALAPADQAANRNLTWIRGAEKIGLQILSEGKQSVVAGIHPESGVPYYWEGATPEHRKAADLPHVDLAALYLRICAALAPLDWTPKANAPEAPRVDPGEAVAAAGSVERHFARSEAERLLRAACVDLNGMAPGTGRGTRVFRLASDLSPLVAGGVVSRDHVADVLRHFVAWEDVERDFDRGLSAPQDPTKNPLMGALTSRPFDGSAATATILPFPTQPVAVTRDYVWDELEAPPVEWLAPNRVHRRGCGFFFGDQGQGKSLSLQDLLVAAVWGGPWAGAFVKPLVDNELAVYFAYEGASGLKQRLAAAAKGRNADRKSDVRTRLRAVIPREAGTDPIGEIERRLAAYAEEKLQPRVIVCDTWSAAGFVKENNSDDEVAAAIRRFYAMVERYGCLFIFVDHMAKHDEGATPRGSSAKLGNTDFGVFVEQGRLQWRKCKDSIEGLPVEHCSYQACETDFGASGYLQWTTEAKGVGTPEEAVAAYLADDARCGATSDLREVARGGVVRASVEGMQAYLERERLSPGDVQRVNQARFVVSLGTLTTVVMKALRDAGHKHGSREVQAVVSKLRSAKKVAEFGGKAQIAFILETLFPEVPIFRPPGNLPT